MSVVRASASRTLMAAPGRAALWRPLAGSSGGNASSSGSSPDTIAGLTGWWDAGSYAGMIDGNGVALPDWNNAVSGLVDKSGVGNNLAVYHQAVTGTAPQATPRLNGTLGGVGLNKVTPPTLPASGYLLPQMDTDTGLQLASPSLGSTAPWTIYLVWSRPNYLQGYGAPSSAALLTFGGTVILSADAMSGSSRLILFPGASQTILTTALERRHTHSVIISSAPGTGVSVWLDASQVVSGAANPLPANQTGTFLFLHSGQILGSAQCWFHEAAMWGRALATSDIATLLSYVTRWKCGARKGVQLVVMGQSNAGYSLTDGAWHLLAQGIAWHLGALAYNVIGAWGSSGSSTCVSGHGISNVPFSATNAQAASVGGDWPGSFLADPGDGSDPAGWPLGLDGTGVLAYVGEQAAADQEDIALIVWPWTETDSIRNYSEKAYYRDAVQNLLTLIRAGLSRSAASLPMMWWNAIPFGSGSTNGIQMVRETAAEIAATSGLNVFIGLPQTSDSNPRGGTWNATNGIFTAGTGDYNHRDATDNLRFGRLAAPVAARAILAATGGDIETAIPSGIPVVGGPIISHVYQATANSATLVLTITHDAGNDLVVPLQAVTGVGFAVMDGGSVALPGNIISAVACSRIDAAHLQITLASAPINPQSELLLFYSYGINNIFRGDAVTDNFASVAKPSGWDIGRDLGSAWTLNYPLAATTAPIAVSATP